MIGVFIEPVGSLRDDIIAWKDLARSVQPGAAYIDHPPHATLFVLRADDVETVLHVLTPVVTACPVIRVETAGWHVFWRDPMTGADTLCVRIRRTTTLCSLQLAVAEVLAPLHDRSGEDSSWPDAFRRSWRSYGFPFVGDHWLPHFTIGSFRDQEAVIDELMGRVLPAECVVGSIALYSIFGEEHRLLQRLELGATA